MDPVAAVMYMCLRWSCLHVEAAQENSWAALPLQCDCLQGSHSMVAMTNVSEQSVAAAAAAFSPCSANAVRALFLWLLL